jgi:HNH endonuclease
MRGTLRERFWSKVKKDGPVPEHRPELGRCWVWVGGIRNRYGSFHINQLQQLAHRVAWFLNTDNWPNPCCLHKCDNPLCVRFSHLFEGTQAANVKDRDDKGRANPLKGSQNGHARLNTKQVVEIRKRYALGGITQRQLAKEYGAYQPAIWKIVTRRTWKHVGE